MDFIYLHDSVRARKVRYAASLSRKAVFSMLATLATLFSVIGSVLILSGQSIGWSVFVPVVLALIVYFWHLGDLSRVETGPFQKPGSILLHEALEPGTLARLPNTTDLSAYGVWKALEKSEDSYFLGNRFGVGHDFFETFADKGPHTAAFVWQEVEKLRLRSGVSEYSNMIILIGLVRSVPDAASMMRHAGLELDDIEAAIEWMKDIKAKRQLARSAQRFGGIGRDWAFGYTPILRKLGYNVSEDVQKHGFYSDTRVHANIVQQMIQILGTSGSTLTLVGDEGVGKTTCVIALADQLLKNPAAPKVVRYSQVIQLDASSLIANARKPGELEDLMIHILNEAHNATNIILFFDEAHMFFGGNNGSVDLTNVLQPVFESGSVRIVLAMNPQHWQRLSSVGLAAKLTPIQIPPTNQADTLAILRDSVGVLEHRHNIVFTYQALEEAYKLGSRYVTTQSMPGAALAVLKQAAANTQAQLVSRDIIQSSVEQTYGIKLQTADSEESSNLLHLEDDLRKQVVSQDRAISVIANALRRSRSGVGNPDRPIGTFLFLGPTGVGKTELSKALARSYFGDEKALIRVDMNQYVAASDVARLISPLSGNELGLVGEVRKNPFSVILLDEIEKAHPAVINTLLQTLDEGILRDSDNRAVSFRDAIIIATSNAGADEIRAMIDGGKDASEFEAKLMDLLIAKGSFAPEFVNRFDEVVLFKPLLPADLVRVIDIIMDGINKTVDAKKINISLTGEAKQWLIAKGYDPKLGARPMRRMTQRYVENIIAKQLLAQTLQPGTTLQLDVKDLEAAE